MISTAAPSLPGGDVFSFSSLDSLVGAVEAWSTGVDVRGRIRAGQRLALMGEALQTAAAAELVGADGDTRVAQAALGGRKTSKRAARKVAKRAGAAAKNSAIADKMASGDLSGEQVDALLDADAKTDGAAVENDELVEELAKAAADESAKILDDFVTDTADGDSVQAEHDRQRRLRSAYKHRGRFGLGAITFEGDAASIDAAWKQLRADADKLYKADGGRNVPHGVHPRTDDQRLFDSVIARITGTADTEDTEDTADTEDVTSGSDTCGTAAAKPAAPVASRRYTAPARRPTVVITATAEKIATGDGPLAVQLGVGPIADSVLAGYLANSAGVDLVGAVFSADGQPLWLGRKSRYASEAQFLALVIRDKGCVQCGASYDQCQVHHLTPWHALAQGLTDIDNLALVCQSCHTNLHNAHLTLYQAPNGHWKTRPATPDEIAPRRPTSSRESTQRGPTRTPEPGTGATSEQSPKRRPTPRRGPPTTDTNDATLFEPADEPSEPDEPHRKPRAA